MDNFYNDLAISPRSTDFSVQISAFNIHSHCSQMFGQNTVSLILVYVIFHDYYS